MSGVRRRRAARSTALAFGLLAGAAAAQETAPRPATETALAPAFDDTDDARAAFRKGSELAKQGKWLDALAAFRKSAELRPHPVTTYDIAYSERALGHYVQAFVEFRAALAPPSSPGAPVLSEELAAQARGYLTDVERGVARMDVTWLPSDRALRVDGLPVISLGEVDGTEVYGIARAPGEFPRPPLRFSLWLDPGNHVFVVTGSDGRERVQSHSAREGSSGSLLLDVAVPPAAAEPAPVVVAPPPSPDRTAAYVSFGVAGAALVFSAVFAELSLHEMRGLDSDPRCSGSICPDEPHYRDQESRLRTDADLATMGLAVGLAAGAAGAYFWFTATPPKEARGRRLGVGAFVGPGSAGLRGSF
ncbi:MAG TPA: tetratricopeptide repeat protein [Polyangiaceae bacterium]|nr:tetratricopeptide repeat protein [Polyangiaceae bacterium]